MTLVIKGADKGSGVVVWDRGDYLMEAERHLSDKRTYEEINLEKDTLSRLSQRSNKYFYELCAAGSISKTVRNYFLFAVKNAATLAKMYMLPKIHKRHFNVPGRAVISNCGAVTEKVSEFLDHHLKPIMLSGETYIRDSFDFLEKAKSIGPIPESAILVLRT